MRHAIVAFVMLSYAVPVSAQEVPYCDGHDCATLMEEVVQWVAASQSYAPERILLDTEASGIQRINGGQSIRTIPILLLNSVVRAAHLKYATPSEVARCRAATGGEDCNIKAGDVLVTLHAPTSRLTNQDQVQLRVTLTKPELAPRLAGSELYLLTVAQVGTGEWEVVDARQVGP
ncbi:MAG: hypothetical protein WEF86_00935 [Gemmatimonadota bacterium]